MLAFIVRNFVKIAHSYLLGTIELAEILPIRFKRKNTLPHSCKICTTKLVKAFGLSVNLKGS